MIMALIPAAGKSSRMGRPKLTLPLGDRSILEHVLEALRRAGIEHILVVAGPHVPELVSLAETAGAHALLLAEETPDMRATVECGLNWLEGHCHPRGDDQWLLIPADHPALDEAVVRQLLHARQLRADCSIVIPTFQGQRGHPALIDWKHSSGIRTFPEGMGLNAYLRRHASETLELPVDVPGILVNLDTPEDYERLLQNRSSAGKPPA
jgi:molybdenum cofactor cytidylyltransferase